jgi:hypothetical protein
VKNTGVIGQIMLSEFRLRADAELTSSRRWSIFVTPARRQIPPRESAKFQRVAIVVWWLDYDALQRIAQGESQADIARSFAVDPATICRLAAASPFAQSAAGDLVRR